MKRNKGITLISLVITVIVLSILASIATYSGINVIRSSKYTAFTAELKIMQTHVNAIYEENKGKEDASYGYAIGTNEQVQAQARRVFTAEASGITDETGYRYWSEEYIKNNLKIEGVEQAFFVNLEKRSVVSYEGFEYEGETYYTLEQLPNGLYNVDYEAPNAEQPTFDVKTETIGADKWRITVSNIQYSGYIDKWQVVYQLENKDYWSTTEDLSFVVNEAGNYNIKLVNQKVQSDVKPIQVLLTVEGARIQQKVFEKKTTVQDTSGEKLIIPEGFKIASDSADLVEEGVVIEDITANHNQFVWVPVDNINDFVRTGGYSNGSQQSITNYTEPFANGYSTETTTEVSEYNAMKKSVEDNHGFYIGRFEAGKDSSGNVVVKKGADVYNNVPWGNAMDDIEGTTNTSGKVGAVKLSKEFASKNNYIGVTSTLCYGVQWDATMQFMDSKYISGTCEADSYARNSSKKGWYSDNYNSTEAGNTETNSNKITGKDLVYSDKPTEIANKQKNIYDMAGNVWEWTMEAHGTDSRVNCGGGYDSDGSRYPASGRDSNNPDFTYGSIGFRVALYL